MAFDVDGARKAGYSDAEIADFLGQQANFDVAGARQSGYADTEILKHIQRQQRVPAGQPPEEGGIKSLIATGAKQASDYLGEQAGMIGTDLKIGFENTKIAGKNLKLANLMDVQEARKEKYGTAENMPEDVRADYLKTQKSVEETLRSIGKTATEIGEIKRKEGQRASTSAFEEMQQSPEYKEGTQLDRMAMTGKAFMQDPVGMTVDLGLQSLPQSLEVAATVMMARFGLLNPKAAAAAGGASSAMMEFGNQYAQLRQQGVPHGEAWEKAGIKSGVIGLLDAASMGSAGKAAGQVMSNLEKGAFKETAKEVAKETGKQAALGGAGEGLGSLAIGERIDPAQVAAEMVGEVFGAPGEAIGTYQGIKTEQDVERARVEEEKQRKEILNRLYEEEKAKYDAAQQPVEPAVEPTEPAKPAETPTLVREPQEPFVAPPSEAQDTQAMIDELFPPTRPEEVVTEEPETKVERMERVEKKLFQPIEPAAEMPKTAKPVVLQNRDRSTPASVNQMQSIAANPDYDRLKYNPVANSGAPIVFGKADIKPEQMGIKDIVTSENGSKYPVQYAVVSADDVLPSNKADGTVNEDYANYGGLRAIGGNGRVAGLQAAFERGTAKGYVEGLTSDSVHGVTPEVIKGIKNPILVRIMPPQYVNDQTADDFNVSGTMDLSLVEQASNDARRVDLTKLSTDDQGNITMKALKEFISAMPQKEMATLMDKSGNPTNQAMQRLEAAVFQKAYQNPGLVSIAYESADNEARNIIKALTNVAPQMMRLEGTQYDIRADLVAAVEKAINARRSGLSLQDAAKQVGIDEAPGVNDFVQVFADNIRSAKAITNYLSDFANAAYEETKAPAEGLFGETPRRTIEQLKEKIKPVETKDLFAEPEEKKVAEKPEEKPTKWEDSEFADRIKALFNKLEEAGLQDDAKIMRLGLELEAKQGKLNEESMKFREKWVQGQINTKKVLDAETTEPVEFKPATKEWMNSKYPESKLLPEELTDAAVEKWNELGAKLAAKGFEYLKVDARHPKEVRDINDAMKAVVNAFSSLATQRYAKAREYKNFKQQKLDRMEDAATKAWGINTRAYPGVDVSQGRVTLDGVTPLKGKKEKKSLRAELEEFFTPGNIIYNDYWKLNDRVVDFNWNDGSWNVTVETVVKRDGQWVTAEAARTHSTKPSPKDYIVSKETTSPIEEFEAAVDIQKESQEKKEQKPQEMGMLNTKIHDMMDEKATEFQVGDEVRLGNMPGVVIGVAGDYVKFRPDNAKSDKAYTNVLAKNLTFVSRPGKGVTAASKAEDNKLGTVQGKLNADMGGLIQLLGANMYAANIGDVAVKELLQNAFDASKAAVKLGIVDTGRIDIEINAENRTITVKDNARGMTPSIVNDAFFTVAGSDKSDLDPSERSGGLGLAKMGFMLGAETLKLDTVRDGIRTTVDTNSKDIANSKFKIVKSKAPEGEHGTSVTVKIPEKYVDPKTGDEKDIWFPWSADSIDSLTKPLIGPVEINVKYVERYGDVNEKVLPVGVNFDTSKMPLLTTARFSWGNADIYYGVERKEHPKHEVLSSGVYQFRERFMLTKSERIPYDIIVNIKPNVEAKHPDYPFENSRERFKGRLEKDIESLTDYLAKVARGNEATDLQESFKGIVSMPRVEAGADVRDASQKLKKVFDKRGMEESQFTLPEMPREVIISDGHVRDLAGVDVVKPQDQKKESTFRADKEAPTREDFMIEMDQDPSLPIFHNNTNVDYLEIGRQYGEPEQFFAELGTLMVEMKEELARSGIYGYDALLPENLFFAGVSIDKKYGGVHIKLPYKAVFLNPFYDWGAKTLFGIRQNFLNTMIHELAHQGDMDHGVGHNNQMIKVEQYLADQGLLDYFRDALLDVLTRHESTFTAMREAYGRSTTQNTAKSLEDYQGKPSARGDEGSRFHATPALSAGERQGRGLDLRTDREGAGKGAVDGGGRKPPVIGPRRNYKGGQAPDASWEDPDITRMDTFVRTVQDRHVDTKRVQEAITKTAGEIQDELNVYRKEELYHGKSAKRTEDFLEKELRPLVAKMISYGVTVDQLNEYLHNRHAVERNVQMNKVNTESEEQYEERIEQEELQYAEGLIDAVDYSRKILRVEDVGSGISTKDAIAYMNSLKPEEISRLESLAQDIDKIVYETQEILVRSGLEDAKTILKWRQTYKHYVPLFREDIDFVNTSAGIGQGYSSKSDFSRRAVGSEKPVADIFANIAAQRERAIIRDEKTVVGRALLGLAIMNPNPKFWLPVNPDAIKSRKKLIAELKNLGIENPEEYADNLMEEPRTGDIDPRTGLATFKINSFMRNSDNVFAVRVNGKKRYIIFNPSDDRAMEMVRALKNLNADQLGWVMGNMAKATRWMASVNTQYNPVFGLINFARDFWSTQLNLSTTELAGKQKEVRSHIWPAMWGIYSDLREHKSAEDNYWAKLWEDFQLHGGQTGYRDQFSKSREQASIIQREMNKLNQGNIMQLVNGITGWLSDYNDAMENAIRLAAYKTALDNGLSKDKAASLAKNLSVNFNRKGTMATYTGALYAFFGAAVQGTARNFETLRGPKGKAIVLGGFLLGVFQALGLALAGFGDDEPKEFIKQKNLVIPIGDNYMAIPMPLGLNAIPNWGRILTEMVLNGIFKGGRDIPKKMTNLLTSTIDSINPFGSGGILQIIAPTVVDPFAAIAENEDPFGRPIYKEDRATQPVPGYLRSRESASEFGKMVAKLMNYATLGGEYTKGKWSPTGDEIDYLAGQALGGVYKEGKKLAGFVHDIVTGEPTETHRIPIVGRVFGSRTSNSAISDRFYSNVTHLAEVELELKGRREKNENVYKFMRSNPEYQLINQANQLENTISSMNKKRDEMKKMGLPKSQIENLDKQKFNLMKSFNERYDKIK